MRIGGVSPAEMRAWRFFSERDGVCAHASGPLAGWLAAHIDVPGHPAHVFEARQIERERMSCAWARQSGGKIRGCGRVPHGVDSVVGRELGLRGDLLCYRAAERSVRPGDQDGPLATSSCHPL